MRCLDFPSQIALATGVETKSAISRNTSSQCLCTAYALATGVETKSAISRNTSSQCLCTAYALATGIETKSAISRNTSSQCLCTAYAYPLLMHWLLVSRLNQRLVSVPVGNE